MKNLILIFVALGLANCRTTHNDYAVKYKLRLEKGDTLTAIAKKYDTTWQSIAEINHLGLTPKLARGQIILVQPGPAGLRADMGISDPAFPETPALETPHTSKPKGLLFNNNSTDSSAIWPLDGKISSEFGIRGRKKHSGIDIRAPSGTSIMAVDQGVVEFSGWKRGYGKTIIINHGSFKTLYAHCSKTHVDVNQSIRQGQEIANVGRSGNASGYHLHFEYLDGNDTPKNPREILDNETPSRSFSH